MSDVSKIQLPDNTVVDIKDARIPGVDNVPTSGSDNIVKSGGVYSALLSPSLKHVAYEGFTSSSSYAVHCGVYYKPDDWNKMCSFRFRVHAYVPSQANVESISDITVQCYQGVVKSYYIMNGIADTSNYAYYSLYYYGVTAAGHTAGAQGYFGVYINSANCWSYTTKRQLEYDLIHAEGCTVGLFTTDKNSADARQGYASGNFLSSVKYNTYTAGLQETGDSNTTYSVISNDELRTGTATSSRTVSAARLAANYSITTDSTTGAKTVNIAGVSATIPDAVEANPTVPSGTTPTSLTGLKVGSDYYGISAGSSDAVLYTAQSLSDAQKTQARTNIGATAPEIFWATYGTTTFADVKTAYEAGKEVLVKYTVEGSDLICPVAGTTVNNGEIVGLTFVQIGGIGVFVLNVSSTGWTMAIVAIEVQGNKVTSLSSSSTDTQYPSAKCVYDALVAIPTDSVRYSQQALTDAQKKQARLNQGLYYPEPVTETTITWNGSTTGLDTLSYYGDTLYKVASSPIDAPLSAYGTVTTHEPEDDYTGTLTWRQMTSADGLTAGKASIGTGGVGSVDRIIIVTNEANFGSGVVNDGIYFSLFDDTDYISSLSISSYIRSDNTIPTACLENVTDEITSTSTETEIASGKAVYNAVHPKLKDGGSYIDPNVLYDYGYMEEGIVLYLNTPSDNTIENEYKFCFRQGSTVSSLTWPTGITWLGNCLNSNGVPVMHANCYYEVSIMNSCGIIVEWKL